MSQSQETTNYATRIPNEKAEEIEQYRDREAMNKSEAIRQLVRAGLREQSTRYRFFRYASLSAVAVLVAAGLVVAVFTAMVATAAATGEIVGIEPVPVLVAGLATLGVIAASGLLLAVLYAAGVPGWLDGKMSTVDKWLGINH